jgi:hypothetical protein
VDVYLLLNMSHFVDDEDKQLFERMRATTDLMRALRNQWGKTMAADGKYFRLMTPFASMYGSPSSGDGSSPGFDDDACGLHAGFLTGVFRKYPIERFFTPV